MSIRVITSKQAWKGFLRRAKQSWPNEHLESMYGSELVDEYRITDFVKMEITKSTPNEVKPDEMEPDRHKWLAKQEGKIWLGTIHSHPKASYDSSPSSDDHHHGAIDGERLMGVIVLYKKNGRFIHEVNFWKPQPKVHFEIM